MATSVSQTSGRESWHSRTRSRLPGAGWTSRSTATTDRARPLAWSRAAAAPIPAKRSSPPRPIASWSSPTPRRRGRHRGSHPAGARRLRARLDPGAAKAELGELAPRPGAPPRPDGGVIADDAGEVGDPREPAAALAAVPGVVDHGPSRLDGLRGDRRRGDGVERAEERASRPSCRPSAWRQLRAIGPLPAMTRSRTCRRPPALGTNVGWDLPGRWRPRRSASGRRW